MQRIAYEDNPYVIFYYDNQLEAWRTDKFEGWTKTPTERRPRPGGIHVLDRDLH